MKSRALYVVAVAIVSWAFPGQHLSAQTIAKWTFETSIPSTSGPYSPEIGLGSASGVHSGAAVYSSPAGDGSTHSFSVNTWAVADYWQFSSATTGYSGIELEWDQISSSTGPRDFDLSYSTDGTTYSPIQTYSVIVNSSPNAWSSSTYSGASHYAVDLSAYSALNNAATVYFRLTDDSTVSASGGTVAVAGTDRIDNFTIEVAPEPQAFALIGGFALLAIGFIRRKN